MPAKSSGARAAEPVHELAESATECEIAAGQTVVAEGRPADAFYVVVEGSFAVTERGHKDQAKRLSALHDGDYFGEIGLLEQLPRTATVTTMTASRLLRIDGAAFLEALTEPAPSSALLDGAALRLRRTHPSLPVTQSGLRVKTVHRQ